MKLIIQIPCYNEAETLEIALNALPKKIDGIDKIEYLIINDGSIELRKTGASIISLISSGTKGWRKALWPAWMHA